MGERLHKFTKGEVVLSAQCISTGRAADSYLQTVWLLYDGLHTVKWLCHDTACGRVLHECHACDYLCTPQTSAQGCCLLPAPYTINSGSRHRESTGRSLISGCWSVNLRWLTRACHVIMCVGPVRYLYPAVQVRTYEPGMRAPCIRNYQHVINHVVLGLLARPWASPFPAKHQGL